MKQKGYRLNMKDVPFVLKNINTVENIMSKKMAIL